jgi:hypothetical protein
LCTMRPRQKIDDKCGFGIDVTAFDAPQEMSSKSWYRASQ